MWGLRGFCADVVGADNRWCFFGGVGGGGGGAGGESQCLEDVRIGWVGSWVLLPEFVEQLRPVMPHHQGASALVSVAAQVSLDAASFRPGVGVPCHPGQQSRDEAEGAHPVVPQGLVAGPVGVQVHVSLEVASVQELLKAELLQPNGDQSDVGLRQGRLDLGDLRRPQPAVDSSESPQEDDHCVLVLP